MRLVFSFEDCEISIYYRLSTDRIAVPQVFYLSVISSTFLRNGADKEGDHFRRKGGR